MQRRLLVAALVIAALAAAWYFLSPSDTATYDAPVSVTVQRGPFKIYVTATGELKAKNSVKIYGPSGMRTAYIYQTTITDMVPEGTVVKKGDYVATLDRSELDQRIKDGRTEIEKIETQLQQAVIDTAIELRGLRDEIINMRFAMEEKKLQVEQSRYEPAMVIRQAEMELEKARRDYQQLLERYRLTQEKSRAKVSEILASLAQQQRRLQQLLDVADEFVVRAPADGMVIYAQSWNGKVGPGSQISAWDPVVAELPDLSEMLSRTWVNEVDISKVQVGQDATVRVDAFPGRQYAGRVVSVANIGEELKGYDAKVFEVNIELLETDSLLRPAMTTSNEILTWQYDSVLHVPLEAVFRDSATFVYLETPSGLVKQEVITGEANDRAIIIEYGLEEGQTVRLTAPPAAETLPFRPLPEEVRAEILRKQEEARKRRQAIMEEKRKATPAFQPEQESNSGGFIIVY